MKFLNWTLSLALTLGLLTGCAPAFSGSASTEVTFRETGSTVKAPARVWEESAVFP